MPKPSKSLAPQQGSASAEPSTKTPDTPAYLNRISPRARPLFLLVPVLWFENRQAYDALLEALLDEHDPVSITETLLVKDLADCLWELYRIQRIRRAAVTLQLPASAWKLLHFAFENEVLNNGPYGGREELDDMLRDVVNGSDEARVALKRMQDAAKVSNDELLHEVYTSNLSTLSMIDAALGRIERRRTALLRLIDQRQRTNASLNKAYFDGMMSRASNGPVPPEDNGGVDGDD